MFCRGKTYIKGICDKCLRQSECNPIRKPTKNERIAKLESENDSALEAHRIRGLEISAILKRLDILEKDDVFHHEDVNRIMKRLIRIEQPVVPTKQPSSKKIHAIANDHAKRGRQKKE